MQFERQGYFARDVDSAPGRPVFNRTVGLRDSYAKALAGKGDRAGPAGPAVAGRFNCRWRPPTREPRGPETAGGGVGVAPDGGVGQGAAGGRRPHR